MVAKGHYLFIITDQFIKKIYELFLAFLVVCCKCHFLCLLEWVLLYVGWRPRLQAQCWGHKITVQSIVSLHLASGLFFNLFWLQSTCILIKSSKRLLRPFLKILPKLIKPLLLVSKLKGRLIL